MKFSLKTDFPDSRRRPTTRQAAGAAKVATSNNDIGSGGSISLIG